MADGRMRSFFSHDFRVAKFYFLALVRCILVQSALEQPALLDGASALVRAHQTPLRSSCPCE